MRVTIPAVELDPILLLLPDAYGPLTGHPFNGVWLAELINRGLERTDDPNEGMAFLRMIPPEDTGLDRWGLFWRFYEDEADDGTVWVADRDTRRPSDLRKVLPAPVVRRLRTVGGYNLRGNPKKI